MLQYTKRVHRFLSILIILSLTVGQFIDTSGLVLQASEEERSVTICSKNYGNHPGDTFAYTIQIMQKGEGYQFYQGNYTVDGEEKSTNDGVIQNISKDQKIILHNLDSETSIKIEQVKKDGYQTVYRDGSNISYDSEIEITDINSARIVEAINLTTMNRTFTKVWLDNNNHDSIRPDACATREAYIQFDTLEVRIRRSSNDQSGWRDDELFHSRKERR